MPTSTIPKPFTVDLTSARTLTGGSWVPIFPYPRIIELQLGAVKVTLPCVIRPS